jgi:hypothetical protein
MSFQEKTAGACPSGSEGFFEDNTDADFADDLPEAPRTPEELARGDRHRKAWAQRKAVREMDGVS